MEDFKLWLECQIYTADERLRNAASDDDYKINEAKKEELLRVLRRLNFHMSLENLEDQDYVLYYRFTYYSDTYYSDTYLSFSVKYKLQIRTDFIWTSFKQSNEK